MTKRYPPGSRKVLQDSAGRLYVRVDWHRVYAPERSTFQKDDTVMALYIGRAHEVMSVRACPNTSGDDRGELWADYNHLHERKR